MHLLSPALQLVSRYWPVKKLVVVVEVEEEIPHSTFLRMKVGKVRGGGDAAGASWPQTCL